MNLIYSMTPRPCPKGAIHPIAGRVADLPMHGSKNVYIIARISQYIIAAWPQ